MRLGASLLAGAVVVACFAACGDDPSISPSEDGGTDADPRDAAHDGAIEPPVDAGPVRAAHGLDVRPPNPTCRAPARPPPPRAGFRITEVFQGANLDEPTGMAQLPGDRSKVFFIERAGRLVSVPTTGPAQKRVVATMPDPVMTVGELGMFGFAFHPRFAQNGYVYFLYFRAAPAPAFTEAVIVRMRSTDGGATFGEPTTIYGPWPFVSDHHVAGDMHFGPDGYLYASFGDDSNPGQPNTRVQSKLVRIDVDGAVPYAIPPGNPWRLGGGEPSVFALGFRNPFRFSIDAPTGNVWVADVGEAGYEEIDLVIAGGHYGFPEREGAHCYPPDVTTCATAGFIDPVVEHSHATDDVHAIITGPVYRGSKMPSHVGELVYGDFSSGKFFTLGSDPRTGAPVSTLQLDVGGVYVFDDIAEDLDHELYALSLSGPVFAIEDGSTAPNVPSTLPEKLSETGCFEKSDPKVPVAAMIPYAPVAPFFSDGAEKERYLALPDGATIGLGPDGDFDFPKGSVLAKHFRHQGKLVETRLFVRHDDGEWGGYGYEWNDAQTDATLLPAGKKTPSWTFPSRGDCFRCHTSAAGRTLGLEVAQLDTDLVYARTNRISNQLRTFEHLGLLASPLAPFDSLPRMVSPTASTGLLDARARSYLHTNCSHCHRPSGPTPSSLDLRFGTSLGAMRACGIVPSGSDLGIPDAKLVDPGHPERSILLRRLLAPSPNRMPPLGTSIVDDTSAIEGWIGAIPACP